MPVVKKRIAGNFIVHAKFIVNLQENTNAFFIYLYLFVFQDTLNAIDIMSKLNYFAFKNHVKLKLNSQKSETYFLSLLKNNFKTLLKHPELVF